MRRRDFLTLLVGAAAARPLTAGAQQRAKVPTIGFLGAGTQPAWAPYTGAFLERLRELGWINGRTVKIEYRWAEGRAVNRNTAETLGLIIPSTMLATADEVIE